MEDMLTQRDLCEWLKISEMTAYRWRREGMPHMKMGKLIRYDRAKVQEWLNRKGQGKD